MPVFNVDEKSTNDAELYSAESVVIVPQKSPIREN